MMKVIWRKHSYTILFVATCLTLTLVLANGLKIGKQDYITVTVEAGASLWELAEAYSDEHNLTHQEFVAWVEKENGIIGGKIFAGDQLIVPITGKKLDSTQYASLD
ncbi:cell division suppressor protein YneA [Mesobacillus maritimus]|uniref:cell division suppressor protein YneA n=1 Tax=Mesobacillus maritimus TaxID=1643336 RepID=UPI00203E4CD7|nr:cell division suppressor protein YneA [Mesobacillus maritimus]MCM3667812.1 cell division suppressor protein YneA [Mesobacillus maritimus]